MGLEPLIVLAVGTAALTVALTFLPAAIELKRPKDAGPRFICGCYEVTNICRVVNIEEDAAPNRKPAVLPLGFLDVLPSLEIETI